MCLNPITIINPSKYVSLKYRDRYLLQVPCGHCAQCATNKSNEWYYRSYVHSLDCLSGSESYIIFDTLTYRSKDLPHISDFINVPSDVDFPCFNRRHIQLFNKRLRKYISKFGSYYSFFLTSEYGTSDYYSSNGRLKRATHRPHYHLLLYCDGKVDKFEMSRLISKAWSYGRTDGIVYQPFYHVNNNIFDASKFSESLRTCRYVSKYIQKSCKFQSEIDKRLNSIMMLINDRMNVSGWSDSLHAKRVRQRFNRLMNQFHCQSIGYGASVLRDLDIAEVMRSNELVMPDSKKVKLSIPLPMYYKRKLFYEVVKVDGNDLWHPTDLGIEYLKKREMYQLKNLSSRFEAANHQLGTNFDVDKLSDYVLNVRGRIRASYKSYSPLDKLSAVHLYNYSTLSDREHLDRLGLSRLFAGNNSIGYRYSKLFRRIKFKDFIKEYVLLDPLLESQLEVIYNGYFHVNDERQKAYEVRQRLTNLYHSLGIH